MLYTDNNNNNNNNVQRELKKKKRKKKIKKKIKREGKEHNARFNPGLIRNKRIHFKIVEQYKTLYPS